MLNLLKLRIKEKKEIKLKILKKFLRKKSQLNFWHNFRKIEAQADKWFSSKNRVQEPSKYLGNKKYN